VPFSVIRIFKRIFSYSYAALKTISVGPCRASHSPSVTDSISCELCLTKFSDNITISIPFENKMTELNLCYTSAPPLRLRRSVTHSACGARFLSRHSVALAAR